MFPFGPYFPGFTVSAGLMGLVYGLFLYKKPAKEINDWKYIVLLTISSIIVLGGIKILLESIFLNVLYGKAFLAVVASRAVTQGIMLPIQVITIFLLEKSLRPFAFKYLYKERRITIDEYLNTFDKFTKDPNLDAMKFLMEKFDHPEKKVKFIHIAGTNGKGSIAEMLASILNNTDYKVGKFISPHLIKFNDGIWINDKQISDTEVEEILVPLSKAIEEYNKTHKVPVKWFEAITALSLIYFANKKCDFGVIEAGLGGLNDCTNIINGRINIIGNIGYDHVDILGNDILEIAKHKAGIIKKGSDTVIYRQEEVIRVFEEQCKKVNSNLHIIEKEDVKDYATNKDLQQFSFKEYKNIEINLKGKCQIYNATQVLEAIDILKKDGFKIPDEAIYKGLKTVVHKARFETLSKNPLIIFDGGHNENAIKNLEENIKSYLPSNKKAYIISILKTKDYKTIVQNLVKDENAVFFFTSGNDKKKYVSKENLYKEAKKHLDEGKIFKKDLKDALKICKKDYKDRTILIVGSFYVYKTVVEELKK